MGEIESITLTKLKSIDQNIVEVLHKLPRTGKAVRIYQYQLPLPIQSIYDHVLSVARNMDELSSFFDLKYSNDALACYVAFHDLAEVVSGDHPDFTTKELASLTKHYLSSIEEKELQEKEFTKEFLNSLEGDVRHEFETAINLYKSDYYFQTFFSICDKTEPIIAIWRYIAIFRKTLNIEVFLTAMTDFFTNPKVQEVASANKNVLRLVKFLQDKGKAKNFYLEGDSYLEDSGFPLLKSLILESKMYFTKQKSVL
jgi:5'-deoxynucleotidase YfbR-like HD superfamily hydrolase